mgnify:CR=1 FL=1
MSVRHFLSMMDYTPDELVGLIRRGIELKNLRNRGVLFEPLKNRVLGMIFEKASTRTRLSFEAGMIQLGGQAIFLSPRDTQLGRGEPISDCAIGEVETILGTSTDPSADARPITGTGTVKGAVKGTGTTDV